MNCHLFLFDKILKGSRIVLYGAGSVGNQFYEQIAETNFCEVVLWLDKNADGTLTKKPETIASLSVDDYDIVVIAIENESIANEVKTILMNYGIPENKILHKIHVFSLDSIDWNSGILKDISIKEMQRSDIQKAKTVNKKPIVAMVNSDRGCGKPSETFVRLQKDNINAKVNYYNDGTPPTCMNGKCLLTPRNIARAKIYKQTTKANLNDNEILTAISFIDENTDVVFAQFGSVGVGIMNVCKALNLPLIVHFHGFDISVKSVIEHHKAKYFEMFEYSVYIIAVSQCMKNTLINLGCPQEKIVYNPCCPNDDYYLIQPKFSKKLFAAAGRFVSKKAPQNTILAFQKVLKKHPDAKLILAGDGELFESCENLAKQNNLENSVAMPKVFKPEQLKQWLSEAMAFVQHSITAPNGDMEGTPVVVLEANLAGLPVISTLHAGIPDVIINGKTGLLVDEGDIEGMARNMIWVLDNPEKAREMGLAGKENIWKNFNMKKHIGILDEIVYKAAGVA